MKFTVKAKELVALVSAGASVAPPRTSLDIIRSFLIQAEGGKVFMMATDIAITIKKTIDGDDVVVQEEGVVLVDAVKMSAVCGELDKSEDVEVSSTSNMGVCIRQGKSTVFNLNSQDPGNYPEMKFLGTEEPSMVEVDSGELDVMFSRTAFSAMKEKARYAMNGVLLHIVPGEFRLVATDSKRLSFIKRDRDLVSEEVSGVIPLKGVSVLRKFLGGTGTVSLNIDESVIYFRMDNLEVKASLVEGQFPPYNKVIPDYEEEGLIVDREELIKAVRAASVMNTRESMACTFVFTKDKLTLGSRNEAGNATREVDINNPYDEVVDMDLNPTYFLEALRSMECSSVAIRMKDSESAIMVVEKNELTYVIMPMGRKKEEEKKAEKEEPEKAETSS